MVSFYEKEIYTMDDIISVVKNEVEESVYLEFKQAEAFEKTDTKRREISKDVSAFANADGGIIIYGIAEENHKAKELSFINGNEFSKEWLEQIINSNIQRRIDDVKIFPIRENGDVAKTIYVVKIPKSLDAPHLCKDLRFYKRFNFTSAPMEEYEIRQLYGRKLKSKLIIDSYALKLLKPENEDDDADEQSMGSKTVVFEVNIFNDGDVTETQYKLNVYFNEFKDSIRITWQREHDNYEYTYLEPERIKVSAVGKAPIFPSEAYNAIRFKIIVPDGDLQQAFSGGKIQIGLHYSNGDELIEVDIESFLKKNVAEELPGDK